MSDVLLVEQVSPTVPSANQVLIYPKADKLLHFMPDSGVEQTLSVGVLVENETPGGLINNVNDTYTLAHTPITGSTKLFYRGVRQRLGIDYTEVAATIVYAAASIPKTGANHVIDYRY